MTSEGKKVAVAFKGPDLNEDELLDFIEVRNREDKNRASSAGESREKIGEFIDKTGVNGKALSWLRQIMKANDKSDGQAKAMDIVMSLKNGLPIIEAFVRGQGTQEMDFDADDAPEEDPIPDEIEGDPEDEFANDSFGAGGHAYEVGQERDENPFSGEDERIHHNLWNQGWDAAAEADAKAQEDEGEFERDDANVVTPLRGQA